jgi:2-phospho-L-lactate guanylyltransferase
MKTVLLPVKDFGKAKQRLAGALTGVERAGLAQAMFSDVLAALRGTTQIDRVVVFTASDEVARMARLSGFDVAVEECVDGHSAAVNRMLDRLSADSSIVFSIASDLPALTANDIDFVMTNLSEPFTILPSRDGTGTNGLVFQLPARILVEYGEGSFRRHLSKASAAGLRADVLNVPGFALDIDTPEDLNHFIAVTEAGTRQTGTWKFLTQLHR